MFKENIKVKIKINVFEDCFIYLQQINKLYQDDNARNHYWTICSCDYLPNYSTE